MIIRKALLASVAIAALSATTAFAADLPLRSAPPAYAPPLFTWTGFYLGINAGATFGQKNYGYNNFGYNNVNYSPFLGGGIGSNNNVGFEVGGQLGYNIQFNQIVLGVETDIQYLGNSRNASNNYTYTNLVVGGPAGSNGLYTFNNRQKDGYFGTARGRLGYAFDRLLLFVTGGLAYGNVSTNNAVLYLPAGSPPGTVATLYTRNGRNNTNIGYTLGGGLEYAITNNFTIKGEYLYVNLGNRNNIYSNGPFVAQTNYFNNQNRTSFSVARVGVNYKF